MMNLTRWERKMSVEVKDGVAAVADFVVGAAVGADARRRAATAFKDTLGVMLAGATEPAARTVQALASEDAAGPCRVIGTAIRTSAELAALANGVAAHALDYDDMCFVSLAHPSCALVPAILAAGELAGSPADVLL